MKKKTPRRTGRYLKNTKSNPNESRLSHLSEHFQSSNGSQGVGELPRGWGAAYESQGSP